MSNIQLSGLSTGMDTASIVQQLVQVEQRRLAAYQTKLEGYETKKTAVTELESKVSGLKSALNKLSDASQLRSFKATSGDEDVLSVEASSSAFEGSHEVVVKQLASPERWIHSGFKYATSYVGAGNFILSYNNQELVVDTQENTTLKDLVNRINSDPNNPGITASILEYDDGSGTPFHLVLNGQDSGSDYQIKVNTSNTEVHKSAAMLLKNSSSTAEGTTKLVELDGFTKLESDNAVDQIRIHGFDHDGNAVDSTIEINRYSTVDDLLEGIEAVFGNTVKVTQDEGAIVVTDTTSGTSLLQVNLELLPGSGSSSQWTPPAITQSTQGGSVTANIASLAQTGFSELQDAKDALLRVDGYPSAEGQWISRSSNTIDDVITGVTLNLHSTSEILEEGIDGADSTYKGTQISMNRNTEQLKEKIKAMVEAYNTVIMYLDEKTSYDAKNKQSGVLSSEYALSSISTLIRMPLISNAVGFTTNDSFMNPKDLGFEIDSDGMLSLDEGVFDEAIVENYTGVLALIGAQKTGTSTGSGASVIKFSQAGRMTESGSYDVKVDASGKAWIKKTGEDWSQAREATIDDKGYIIGNMDMNSKGTTPLHPEHSLMLKFEGTAGVEYTATVSVRQGFAGDLFEDVDKMLKSDGSIPAAENSMQSRIDAIEERIENEEVRLEKYEARLKARYARLEATLSQIQQQMSGLTAL